MADVYVANFREYEIKADANAPRTKAQQLDMRFKINRDAVFAAKSRAHRESHLMHQCRRLGLNPDDYLPNLQ